MVIPYGGKLAQTLSVRTYILWALKILSAKSLILDLPYFKIFEINPFLSKTVLTKMSEMKPLESLQ